MNKEDPPKMSILIVKARVNRSSVGSEFHYCYGEPFNNHRNANQ